MPCEVAFQACCARRAPAEAVDATHISRWRSRPTDSVRAMRLPEIFMLCLDPFRTPGRDGCVVVGCAVVVWVVGACVVGASVVGACVVGGCVVVGRLGVPLMSTSVT